MDGLVGSQMNLGALVLAGVLAALAIVALLRARDLRAESGLPAGNVIYADDGAWFPQGDPLFIEDIRLTGKPDYLVEQADGGIIPVEIKSQVAPSQPHEGHILQLAAYCLLVYENFGVRPTHGIIQYKDAAFEIEYTDELEEDLLDLLSEMREDMFADEVNRDHNDWYRCSRCGLRQACQQRLA